MKNRILKAIRISLLLISGMALAQTSNNIAVNNGAMYILPNTLISTHSDFENSTSGVVFNDGEFQFYKNYNNNGLFTHSSNATTGYTIFQGSEPQIIAGSQPSKHYDLLFNNNSTAYAFQLKNDFIIDGTVSFLNGIVKVNPDQEGAMLFTEKANHVNTSNKSYAEGMVEKEGNTPFVFPVGKQKLYRAAGISAPKNVTDSFKAEYFLENSNAIHPHFNKTGVIRLIDDAEYWTVSRDNNQSHVILSLTWNEDTTPLALVSEAENLRVIRWDAKQNLWVNEGGIIDFGAKTVTTPVAVEDFGLFTLGLIKPEVILPGDVVVYNYLTTNGNDKNDYLIIDNIERYPNNRLEIFNRYGVKVYETTAYGSNGNVFTGYSEGRMTVGKDKLPTGTYYYILAYEKTDAPGGAQTVKKAGYIHLENN